MRLRHKKGAETNILTSPLVINEMANAYRGGFPCEHIVGASYASTFTSESIFGNKKPLHLELGMGKGKFIIKLSEQNPDINFIGIEKSATIVLKAIDNYLYELKNRYENENIDNSLLSSKGLNSNLRFMCINIENLENIFMPHSIDKIYLNFSDPWPKKRHASRRLTHHKFLSIYKKILKPDSLLEFKTDNHDLFNFTLEEIENSDFKLINYTYDLHNDEKLNKDNVMTEYEEKFSKLGNKIFKLIAKI